MIRSFKATFHDTNWPKRILYMLLFMAAFTLVGYYMPRLYLQYLDKTKYIEILETVSFDKKVYGQCDTAVARIRTRLNVDSKTTTDSRLMKVETEKTPPDNFKVIETTHSEGFVKAQPEPQTFIVDYPIPCSLEDGTYFFRAEISYTVNGVQKVEPFETALFTIDSALKPGKPHT